MRLFICDKTRITKYNLPSKIEDSFLVPYRLSNDLEPKYFIVESENGIWNIKSNGTINIVDNNEVINSKLLNTNYVDCTHMKIVGSKNNLIVYSLPIEKLDVFNIAINNLDLITIGNNGCNINYKSQLVTNKQVEIKKENNGYVLHAISSENFITYVNYTATKMHKLKMGDVIFLGGIKLVWLNDYIKVYTNKDVTQFIGLSQYNEIIVNNSEYTPVNEDDQNTDLYKEEDYFYHTPRIVQQLEQVEFTIDSPPSPTAQEDMPLWITLGSSITMLASSSMMVLNIINSVSSNYTIMRILPQIIMCGGMLLGGLIMPFIIKKYQKNQKIKTDKLNTQKYSEYLDNIENLINQELKKEINIINENNLTVSECYDMGINHNRQFWSRFIYNDDFLNVRLGIGSTPSSILINYPNKGFSLEENELLDKAIKIGKSASLLNDVPIIANLKQFPTLGFVFQCSYKENYINNIITELVTLHSANDLKLIFLTNEDGSLNYAKYLPHVFSEDKSIRFFATDVDDAKAISSYLLTELDERTTKDNGINAPYYLIITDSYKTYKTLPIIKKLENSDTNYGMSFITLSDSIKNISDKSEKIVNIGEKESAIMDTEFKTQNQIFFKNDLTPYLDMRYLSTKLSNIPITTKDGSSELPKSLNFLEMFNVSKIEQLNIANRWLNNNPVSSLSTPIGVHTDGTTFKLDLHEKFHGPHGLIAGSTGSGKSEFIITYILSMAVNYHPYEVQFVLIDYKGGGLAGAFQNKETNVKIPHLVGTITNLDTAEMNRTLVSISSELKRRQRKFNEVKDKLNESTMDIYKYQRLYREGLIDEPMAHLFIISDEFAELKSQQPEFLQELVSTARIGRSLGVHLILATQKPSGVVNDQIWSNSKFKVCLKVQDKSDSNEVLKKPDAASLKDVGRFYLQVGYDDYFDIGQSGWGGAKYIPSDRIMKKVDDSINIIDNVGNIIKRTDEVIKTDISNVDLGDQLTNTVKYIYELSKKNQIYTNNLWLDKLPNTIYLGNLLKKYKYSYRAFDINPIIGEYDSPSTQEQGLLTVDMNAKNTIIYGVNGSGKEQLLNTLIWSSCTTHSPDEINYYMIDCGSEALRMFNKFPHVGGIASIDEQDKIIDILTYAEKEMDRRRETYSDFGGSYRNYIENSGNTEPLLVFVINNYEIFQENYPRIIDNLTPFFRDGIKYGIEFVITCTTTNSIRSRIVQMFNNIITLKLPQASDYRDVLGAPRGFVPQDNFGRGAIKYNKLVVEFQTASVAPQKDLVDLIRNASVKLNAGYISKAKKIKSLPNIVTRKDLEIKNFDLTNIPLGLNYRNKELITYNFTKNNLNIITGENVPLSLPFILSIINSIKLNANVKVVDLVNAFKKIEDVTIIRDNFDKELAVINNEICAQNDNSKPLVYVFMGAGLFRDKLSSLSNDIINNFLLASNEFKNTYIIFVDNYNSIKNIQLEPWFNNVSTESGIWVGNNISNQVIFNISNLSSDDRQFNKDQMSFVINNTNYCIIKNLMEVANNEE